MQAVVRPLDMNKPKHRSFEPLLEVCVSKKCAQLAREAHFEVKNVKAAKTILWSEGAGRRTLTCSKTARCRGAKHISEKIWSRYLNSAGEKTAHCWGVENFWTSKCSKKNAHLLEVKTVKAPQMSERFWKFSGSRRCSRREAQLEVQTIKN